MPFVKNVFKMSILTIKSVFIIEFHAGMKYLVGAKIALGFCVLSRKLSICSRIAIREKRLKIVHSTYWKCFIIEFHVGLKVKNPENSLLVCIKVNNSSEEYSMKKILQSGSKYSVHMHNNTIFLKTEECSKHFEGRSLGVFELLQVLVFVLASCCALWLRSCRVESRKTKIYNFRRSGYVHDFIVHKL